MHDDCDHVEISTARVLDLLLPPCQRTTEVREITITELNLAASTAAEVEITAEWTKNKHKNVVPMSIAHEDPSTIACHAEAEAAPSKQPMVKWTSSLHWPDQEDHRHSNYNNKNFHG